MRRVALHAVARALGAALLGTSALAAHAGAQQADPRFTHVAFVHGFLSSADTWAQASSRLASEFAIVPIVPTLGWNHLWFSQASSLRDAMPTNVPRVVSVGHSNGGQISRVYNRAYQNTNVAVNDRAIWVTSLHKGAPLVDNVLDGSLVAGGLLRADIIFDTADWYVYWEIQRGTIPPFWGLLSGSAQWIINMLYSVEMRLARLGYVEEVVAAAVAPVMFDMSPTRSQFYRPTSLSYLNSSDNLAREHTSIVGKVNIRGHYQDPADPYHRPGGILFATLFPDLKNELTIARFIAYSTAVTLFEYYYYDFWDPDPVIDDALYGHAFDWLVVAGIIADLDAFWLDEIGALGPWNSQQLAWEYQNSDGILPDDTQQYPGVAAPFFNNRVHTQQTGSGEVEDVIRYSFATLFGVPRKSELVGGVTLTPASFTVPIGSEFKVTPIVSSLTGTTLQRTVTFTSTNPAVATVSSGGWVTPQSAGTAVIRGTVEGYVGEMTVTVTGAPPPSFNSIAVNGYDSVLSSCTAGEWGISRDAWDAPGPYTYQWTVDGSPVGGNEPWLWFEFGGMGGSGFTIGVTATQVNTGVTHSASKFVTMRAPVGNEVCEM